MADMASVKVGKKLVIDGTPYEVIKFEHVKVAQGKGLERTTLRNLVTGNTMQKTFRESDVVQEAEIITSNAEYLYSDEENVYFMNTSTYEQIGLSTDTVGDKKYYLTEGDKVILQEFEGRAINVQLEPSVSLTVEDTPPGERGDTATGGKKPATTTTGLRVMVPLFLKIGDRIRVDTRTAEYLGRD